VPNFPRLRALALFGRRLVECAERLSLPASKNQHISGLMHRCKQPFWKPRAAVRQPRALSISGPN